MYSVPEVIQAARRRRGWGQRQLAEASGVSQPNLAAIETGSRIPSLAMVARLVRACGLQLRFELEPCHADVDNEIARLHERVPEGRLGTAGRAALITILRLTRAGAALVLDGPMAARLHGAPVADGVERVWCPPDQLRQLQEAATRCYRDLRSLRPRYDEENRLVYEDGDQVRIGECTVTLGVPPPAHPPMELFGESIPVIEAEQLPRYPGWTPRERIAVNRLIALDSNE